MSKSHSPGAEPDAIELLAEDHKRVQKLFKAFENVDRADEEAMRDVVETTCIEMQLHSMLEEELFYPAVRARLAKSDEENQSRLNEAEVKHEVLEELIGKLQELEPDDAMYAAYFSVLVEYAKLHIKEEERELFAAVKKLAGLDLTKLAEDMRVRREELFAEIESEEDTAADGSASGDDESALAELESDEQEEESEDAAEQIDISRTRH